MRFFQLALLVLALFIQYRLWFGHNGVEDYTRIKSVVKSHQETNANLSKRNKLLKADIDDLKLGLEGVEERARHELGMIKPGETFIRVLPKVPHEKKR
ncbi:MULTISPECIES: cell division protein FtsB [Pseudoalteromonas]|uniref:Cell division protein FtsB n=2 Tax=Pseudoalteromonas TaxID=53246 RepID=A0A8I2KRY6_9GAMM|nr:MULTISPECIES: cell division protein FtsB [Pseudoalteromonas]ATD09086.1 cell division protein FtsB [Pseudoalteromonas piscicida]KID36268.1 cell division protein FtsB [Pseudoalteromonas flavipulchra NCIMB 2033 = ATCC BAA-314]KJZ03642.1 cell division protein FtsB [Pseudoalteromonas piscicida]MBD0780440.1 cell division protein FtsB [Pseudoalteromonas flavipulchra]MBE0371717.1 cell division protein FtsB [Pseudoalteromonas flavipulchra NCIMB 2033 = ATCC BAA-314]